MKYAVKKFFFVAATVFLFVQNGHAQQSEPQFSKHAVYAELFGQGILYSLNYDYRFRENMSVRAGFSSWSINPLWLLMTGKLSFTGFPVTANYLLGNGDHRLETGLGFMPATITVEGNDIFFGAEIHEKETVVFGTATAAYRVQPEDGGFLFRIGLTPLFTFESIVLTGGISLGYAF